MSYGVREIVVGFTMDDLMRLIADSDTIETVLIMRWEPLEAFIFITDYDSMVLQCTGMAGVEVLQYCTVVKRGGSVFAFASIDNYGILVEDSWRSTIKLLGIFSGLEYEVYYSADHLEDWI